ncbi:hypothetical protein CERSUDRAFT_58933 [Gelatoporia subvermispora B]|uniref:Cytochrome P450 n=1 Tax=Ceriporiopsis subvermispora (strain B) TaxID=914234 RepID=M2P9H4_CERS8|nr:hypothetical protein CERSUDRAFT_58933 [Gelatoporia subvermispora B]
MLTDLPLFVSLIVAYAFVLATWRRRRDPIHSIKTVGQSAPLLSYIGAYRFLINAEELLREGYHKFKGSTFKIAAMDRWIVIVNGPTMVEELRSLPDEKASFMHAIGEIVQPDYTLGFNTHMETYHVSLVRERLNRNLGNLLPGVTEELELAMDEYIPMRGDEWTPVNGFSLMQRIIGRTASRVLVGAPTCRDTDYIDLSVNFLNDAVRERVLLSLFPPALKPCIGFFMNGAHRTSKRAAGHLKHIIEERLQTLRDLGDDWLERPNDMLMWLIEEAQGEAEPLKEVIKRVLALNFAAMSTTANSAIHALYHLVDNREVAQILLQEAESTIEESGWTKSAFSRMTKLDSFLKESQRFNGHNGMGIVRMTLDEVTLSDGTRIPKGTIVGAGASSMHWDQELYAEPDKFDPFRFHRISQDGDAKVGFASPLSEYIAFGRGRHACPGRFFADVVLKAILSYVVLHYDVKFEDELMRPKNKWVGPAVTPDQHVTILFRKRRL